MYIFFLDFFPFISPQKRNVCFQTKCLFTDQLDSPWKYWWARLFWLSWWYSIYHKGKRRLCGYGFSLRKYRENQENTVKGFSDIHIVFQGCSPPNLRWSDLSLIFFIAVLRLLFNELCDCLIFNKWSKFIFLLRMWDAFWNNEWFPGETENGQRFRDCESKNIEANLASTMEGGNRLEVGGGIRGHQPQPSEGQGSDWRGTHLETLILYSLDKHILRGSGGHWPQWGIRKTNKALEDH